MEYFNKMKKQSLEEKLYTLKFNSDIYSHLKPDQEQCKNCTEKICTIICPAKVYEWNEEEQKLNVNFENCLECGACRISCPSKSLEWEYPKGTKGVTFKQG